MKATLEFDDNIGKEWSGIDLVDLRYSIERGLSIAETACFLKRTDAEVRRKAVELGITQTHGHGESARGFSARWIG